MTTSEPTAENREQPNQPIPYGHGFSSLPPAPPPPLAQLESVGPTRSLAKLAEALSVLLGVATLASLASAYAFFHRSSLVGDLDRLVRPTPDEIAEIARADDLVILMGLVIGPTVLATGILFIIWQFRHAKNAVALGGRLGLGPGWAIGGWFIPVANLILPVRQLRQSARASDPRSGRGTVPGIVTGWSAAYITASVIFFYGAAGTSPSVYASDPIGDLVQSDTLHAIGLVVYAVAGFLCSLMVRTLTQRQEQAIKARTVPA